MFSRLAFACMVLLLSASAPLAWSQNSQDQTAWDLLRKGHPEIARNISSTEREVLRVLTADQLQDFLAGVSPEIVFLSSRETLGDFLRREGFGAFDIQWFSIDGGGGNINGGDFTLRATVGQYDAGTLTGGQFSLTGGFWAVGADSTKLYCDGFESGNTLNWSSATP